MKRDILAREQFFGFKDIVSRRLHNLVQKMKGGGDDPIIKDWSQLKMDEVAQDFIEFVDMFVKQQTKCCALKNPHRNLKWKNCGTTNLLELVYGKIKEAVVNKKEPLERKMARIEELKTMMARHAMFHSYHYAHGDQYYAYDPMQFLRYFHTTGVPNDFKVFKDDIQLNIVRRIMERAWSQPDNEEEWHYPQTVAAFYREHQDLTYHVS